MAWWVGSTISIPRWARGFIFEVACCDCLLNICGASVFSLRSSVSKVPRQQLKKSPGDIGTVTDGESGSSHRDSKTGPESNPHRDISSETLSFSLSFTSIIMVLDLSTWSPSLPFNTPNWRHSQTANIKTVSALPKENQEMKKHRAKW